MERDNRALAAETRDVYARRAESYDRQRTRLIGEARWLNRFARGLPEGAKVLDLGCGTGRPIADWLLGEGFRVTGADFAEPMLEIARARRPEGDWRLVDMRALDLGERFHGIVGWNSFFHLTPEEQHACLPRFAAHLEPDGVMMVTVGPRAGEAVGQVEGDAVYHASLSAAEYAGALEAAGLRMTAYMAEDPDCDQHSILMARRDAG